MKSENVLLRILKDMKKISGFLALAAVIELTAVLLGLISPSIIGNLTQNLYDFTLGETSLDMNFFTKTCGILCLIYVLSSLLEMTRAYVMNNTVSRYFTCSLRKKMSEKITSLPISYLDKTPNGEIISRMMHDVSNMGTTVHNIFSTIISGICKLVIIAVIIFSISPIMAATVLVVVPISIGISAFISSKAEKHFNEVRRLNGKIYALSEEDFSCFDTVKAFKLEKKQNATLKSLAENMKKASVKAYYTSSIIEPVVTFTNSVAYIVICIIGGYMAINGVFSIGSIVKVVLYAQMFAGPLGTIANGISMMQNTFASAKRVYEFLDTEEMPKDNEGMFDDVNGDVKFENVYFSYDKTTPLIKNLNFEVKAGQKVAIVGPTGGGKTTIVNLLMRFYDIDGGRILIDGVDAYSVPKETLRSAFQMVLQDTWLFSGTIADNVAYGKKNATREEVVKACEKAHIDGFIRSLPDGYDTVINEETTNVSAGQKQLLTIARAYLSDRKLLILDEATSNVDTRTEILIQETMDKLTEGRTSFVIAHRLSTITDADMILVVKGGEIVERGTHEELLERGGFYREIYMSQYAPIT